MSCSTGSRDEEHGRACGGWTEEEDELLHSGVLPVPGARPQEGAKFLWVPLVIVRRAAVALPQIDDSAVSRQAECATPDG